MTETLRLKKPATFSFSRTMFSHGWCTLPPFRVIKDEESLERILRLPNGQLVLCTIRDSPGSLRVEVRSRGLLAAAQRAEIARQLRSCLRLDEDLTEFFRSARQMPRFRWIPRAGAGRLLRAPTVFEDIVKMICTTNCSWALTEAMIRNLTNELGERVQDGRASFPLPEAIAGASEAFMRKKIRSGYRSPYLVELAEKVASRKLDVEAWRTSQLPTSDLYKQVRGVKGVGDYAAGNLLRLLGRYDYLALDSWVRARYAKLRHNGRSVSDKTIAKSYAPYGKWRGLFFWLEMTNQVIEEALF